MKFNAQITNILYESIAYTARWGATVGTHHIILLFIYISKPMARNDEFDSGRKSRNSFKAGKLYRHRYITQYHPDLYIIYVKLESLQEQQQLCTFPPKLQPATRRTSSWWPSSDRCDDYYIGIHYTLRVYTMMDRSANASWKLLLTSVAIVVHKTRFAILCDANLYVHMITLLLSHNNMYICEFIQKSGYKAPARGRCVGFFPFIV